MVTQYSFCPLVSPADSQKPGDEEEAHLVLQKEESRSQAVGKSKARHSCSPARVQAASRRLACTRCQLPLRVRGRRDAHIINIHKKGQKYEFGVRRDSCFPTRLSKWRNWYSVTRSSAWDRSTTAVEVLRHPGQNYCVRACVPAQLKGWALLPAPASVTFHCVWNRAQCCFEGQPARWTSGDQL